MLFLFCSLSALSLFQVAQPLVGEKCNVPIYSNVKTRVLRFTNIFSLVLLNMWLMLMGMMVGWLCHLCRALFMGSRDQFVFFGHRHC